MEKLRVNLGINSYDILFSEDFDTLAQAMENIGAPKKLLIVTDTNVEPLYADEVSGKLSEAGFDTAVYAFEAG